MKRILLSLRQARRYPSVFIGLAIIALLIIVSIATPIVIPYSEAVRLWRGGDDVWVANPRNAWPIWYNWFNRTKLPPTIVFDSAQGDGEMTVEETSASTREIHLIHEFDYQYDLFPPELILFTEAHFREKQPFIEMLWFTPDGREIRAGEFSPGPSDAFRFAQDSRLQRRLERSTGIDEILVEQGLFDDPEQEGLQPLKGTYRLEINTVLFEADSEVETKFVSYGLVHGWAGTDHRRRDLFIGLLWGTPIAMSFGLLAALGTTITTMSIAAVGVWFCAPVSSG